MSDFQAIQGSVATSATPSCQAVPALVLGESMTLLQVLRILRKDGIPTYAGCAEHDFARWSRHFRPPAGNPRLSPANLGEALPHLAFHRAVLIPCSDEWLLAVSRLPPSTTRNFPSSVPSCNVSEAMVDKSRFAELLEKADVPRPRTRHLATLDELQTTPEEDFHDSFLKPTVSLPFCQKYRRKGYRVSNRGQAVEIMRHVAFPILLQEFIPGPPDVSYFLEGFIDQCGEVCGMLARRRLRMFPRDLGNSTLSESIELSEIRGAEQSLRKLLRMVQYRGIFNAEFKYDHRDKQFKLLEINARPWWYVEFAAHCGVDVCLMAYRDALGLSNEPVTGYETGRRCIHRVNDLRAWWIQRRRGVTLSSWVRAWRGAEDSLIRWDDPASTVAFFATALQQRKRQIARRQTA